MVVGKLGRERVVEELVKVLTIPEAIETGEKKKN